jgi:hypothetical protein
MKAFSMVFPLMFRESGREGCLPALNRPPLTEKGALS